jgi:two-component system, OmpR family, phosphate regulon sensor histidine kinase PhoR
LVINSKFLSEIRSNLYASSKYLKAFILISFINVFLEILLISKFVPAANQLSLIIILSVFSLLLFFLLLNYIGQKRKVEVFKIEEIIDRIRTNQISSPQEIHLDKYLQNLEKDIKLMFEKSQDDINYLKRLEKMRTEFLANVSHELRTPIFSIQGYIETLLEGAIEDEKVNRNFLEKANLHTINLNNLLNDLIDISMIESGESRMSFRYFNIDSYLKEIVKEFSPLAADKNLKLIYNPARENLQVFGDKNKLKQVLVNLLTNAIKYTEVGKVEVYVHEEQKFAKIIVKDTGIGIPKEDTERIFERFYRVDKARSRAVGGTGLGLAIVKHIIEAHGSKVEVESTIGKGSEFSFRLKK